MPDFKRSLLKFTFLFFYVSIFQSSNFNIEAHAEQVATALEPPYEITKKNMNGEEVTLQFPNLGKLPIVTLETLCTALDPSKSDVDYKIYAEAITEDCEVSLAKPESERHLETPALLYFPLSLKASSLEDLQFRLGYLFQRFLITDDPNEADAQLQLMREFAGNNAGILEILPRNYDAEANLTLASLFDTKKDIYCGRQFLVNAGSAMAEAGRWGSDVGSLKKAVQYFNEAKAGFRFHLVESKLTTLLKDTASSLGYHSEIVSGDERLRLRKFALANSREYYDKKMAEANSADEVDYYDVASANHILSLALDRIADHTEDIEIIKESLVHHEAGIEARRKNSERKTFFAAHSNYADSLELLAEVDKEMPEDKRLEILIKAIKFRRDIIGVVNEKYLGDMAYARFKLGRSLLRSLPRKVYPDLDQQMEILNESEVLLKTAREVFVARKTAQYIRPTDSNLEYAVRYRVWLDRQLAKRDGAAQ